MAKTFPSRPSSFLGISHPFDAMCLDQAVYYFGSTLEGRVQKATKSTGKHDTEAMQAWRAEDVLRRALKLPRKFASLSSSR
jgi:hypothetical protein